MGSIGQKSAFSELGHVAYQLKWNHEMQQHGSKYFDHSPPPPPPTPNPGMGSIGPNSTFFQIMVMFYIQLNVTCYQITLGMGSKGLNSTFSEHGHVVYQIKCNQECSIMVANILPADPSRPPHHKPHTQPGDRFKRSNFNFLRTWLMLYIKLNGILNTATR